MTIEISPADAPAYLDKLQERLGVNLVTLSTIADDGQHIIAASTPAGISLLSTDIPLNASICGHVHRMNFPLVVTDLLSHPLVRDIKNVRHSVSGAYLGYPVRDIEGRVRAVLAAIRDRVHNWTPEQQSQMAIAAVEVLRFLGD